MAAQALAAASAASTAAAHVAADRAALLQRIESEGGGGRWAVKHRPRERADSACLGGLDRVAVELAAASETSTATVANHATVRIVFSCHWMRRSETWIDADQWMAGKQTMRRRWARCFGGNPVDDNDRVRSTDLALLEVIGWLPLVPTTCLLPFTSSQSRPLSIRQSGGWIAEDW